MGQSAIPIHVRTRLVDCIPVSVALSRQCVLPCLMPLLQLALGRAVMVLQTKLHLRQRDRLVCRRCTLVVRLPGALTTASDGVADLPDMMQPFAQRTAHARLRFAASHTAAGRAHDQPHLDLRQCYQRSEVRPGKHACSNLPLSLRSNTDAGYSESFVSWCIQRIQHQLMMPCHFPTVRWRPWQLQ